MKTFLSSGVRESRGIPLGQSDSNPFWTSLTDGPPAEPVPGAVTSLDTQPSWMSDAEWQQLLRDSVTITGTVYGAPSSAQARASAAAAAQESQKAANARTKAALFPALTTPSGSLSPNAVFLIGGVIVLGVVAAAALSR